MFSVLGALALAASAAARPIEVPRTAASQSRPGPALPPALLGAPAAMGPLLSLEPLVPGPLEASPAAAALAIPAAPAALDVELARARAAAERDPGWRYLSAQPVVRLYVAEAPGFGHQAATLALARRLRDLGYGGLIDVVYDQDGDPRAPYTVSAKLEALLPGFDGARIEQTADGLRLRRLPAFQGRLEPVAVAMTAGADDDRRDYARELNADRFLRLAPMGWTDYAETAQTRGRAPVPLEQSPELPLIYRPNDRDGPALAALSGPKAAGLGTLLEAAKETDILAAYGLAYFGPDTLHRLLSGVRLAMEAHPGLFRGGVVVPLLREAADRVRDLRKIADGDDALRGRLGYAKVEDAGLGARIHSQPGDGILLVETGAAPQPYFERLFGLSALPPTVEGKNAVNLARLLGIPYFPRDGDTVYDLFDHLDDGSSGRAILLAAMQALHYGGGEPSAAIARFIGAAMSDTPLRAAFAAARVPQDALGMDKLLRGAAALAHDHGLLGPEADQALGTLERLARESIAADTPLVFPAELARRVWAWIEGNQAVTRVPLREWLARRREAGRPPAGWSWEQLEYQVGRLNSAIRRTDARGFLLRPVALAAIEVLVDDLSDGGRTRAGIQRRLSRAGLPDVRALGAFNLFGRKVLLEDLLLYPNTRVVHLIAAMLHETLAAAGEPHEDAAATVQHMMRFVFGAEMEERTLSLWVSEARQWGDVQHLRRSAVRPSIPESARDPIDRFELPLDTVRMRLAPYLGYADGDQGWSNDYRSAQVHFTTERNKIALGVQPAEKGKEREILLWFKHDSEEWRQVWFWPARAMREEAIKASAKGKEKDLSRALSYERFAAEVLPALDRAMEEFLREERDPDRARFARSVYFAFRGNFRRLSGLELPVFGD